MRTLYTHSLARIALPSAARTNGTVNGTTVDTGVFGNDFRTVMFAILTGTITDGSHAITLQDSDNGSAWAAVDPANLQGAAPTITGANDDALFELGYIVAKQYVRLVVVTSGAITGGIFGGVAILSAASSSPVARA